MNEKFLKPYNSEETEDRIAKIWENSGYFNPDNLVKKDPKRFKKPFSIALPPPNVTGTLHMGHAFEDSIQDVVVRYKRMRGYKTLWIPGTDHAAIATQSKVEKEILKKEDKSRFDLGREEFLKRVNAFAKESHDTIVGQIKKLGASIDWSREAFTFDEKRNFAVRTAFKKMYDEGLIYRGERIVNWDPKGQTTISDDEIVYKEEKTKFYYFKYGPFTIGTSRPETKFGDKYVVMHPDDNRFKDYKHGQKINLEWINGPIVATVIKDEAIDMAFGTGVMTITPSHSVVDFEIASRHNLDKEQIIDKYGKLLPIAGEFAGMKIAEVRDKMIGKLKAKGLFVKEEDYTHNVATAERSGGIIEPQIMRQWFIDVNKKFRRGLLQKTLKELMKKAVSSGKIEIMPDRFQKIYFNWIDNLRDWCISRQIWYGHRIPVWYRQNNGKEEQYCGVDAPKDGEGWTQDEDTLDTWFSSGLWTFSTLGWPEETQDLATYHPTTFMAPGYEILFFWVARMILMSEYLLKDIPFKTVYLHGIVRDSKGQKFSKSLNNGVEPLEIIKKYGADALRMSLIVGVGPGNDMKFDENKVKAYKLFANKLWNIARFIFSIENAIYDPEFKNWSKKDVELYKSLSDLKKELTKEMDEYKFYLVSDKIYQYAWHEFADKILEESKAVFKEGSEGVGDADKKSRTQFLLQTLKDIIHILHPFMPHITEEIWAEFRIRDEGDGNKELLLISPWPEN